MSAAQENTVTDHNRVDIMRALFKAWWDATRPLEDGAFHIEIAWRAWQAAIASDPPAPAYTPQQMAANFRAGQNTERMQQAERAGEVGGALDVEWLKERISSIHSTVSLGHQTGPHAYAGEDFGRYLAEAADACQQIMRALAALAARQPGAQEPVVVEAVATIKLDSDGEFYVDWLTEGGIHDLSVGDVLLAANSAITNDEGYGEVYAAPPAQGIDLGQLWEPIKDAVHTALSAHVPGMRQKRREQVAVYVARQLHEGQRDSARGMAL